jgi:hypothetical protein
VSQRWSTLYPGDELPEISLDVSELTVILVPVSTWDMFPGHHSPGYARHQGQRDVYLNTIALQGVADRAVTDHLGPESWVRRRKLAMLGSVFPGDRLHGRARTLAVRAAEESIEADFAVELSTDRGPAVQAELTVRRWTAPATTPQPSTPTP